MNQHTRPAHDVETTLYGRCNDVKRLKRRRNNVVLTSGAGWDDANIHDEYEYIDPFSC